MCGPIIRQARERRSCDAEVSFFGVCSAQVASITALADRFHMTLTGMKKHVGVLEQAGLVITEKVGRVRTCRIGARRLEEAAAWIERYHQLWDARFGELLPDHRGIETEGEVSWT